VNISLSFLSSSGNEFQTVGPAWYEARQPYVLCQQRGTLRRFGLADRRQRRRGAASEAGMRWRYRGANADTSTPSHQSSRWQSASGARLVILFSIHDHFAVSYLLARAAASSKRPLLSVDVSMCDSVCHSVCLSVCQCVGDFDAISETKQSRASYPGIL